MGETWIFFANVLKPKIIVLNEKLNRGPNKNNKDKDEGNDERSDEKGTTRAKKMIGAMTLNYYCFP